MPTGALPVGVKALGTVVTKREVVGMAAAVDAVAELGIAEAGASNGATEADDGENFQKIETTIAKATRANIPM